MKIIPGSAYAFIIYLLLCPATISCAYSQQWGLYTLYSINGSTKTYLIDTNGTVYKTWNFTVDHKTCFGTYLIPGDTLVRNVIDTANVITGGPISGEILKVDWNNNIIWDFIYSDSTTVTHHDFCPMPNGNVLMIALDTKTAAEGVQAGSAINLARQADKIIEVHPTDPTTGTIVWEWKVWDHLCQDHDPIKDNYVTDINKNPQLININYKNAQSFLHMNGIDYNAVLDQITFSSATFSEVFVIDHSTTIAEAAGHAGGNSGSGGDILYRWGNPETYGIPDPAVFNRAHDAHWIPSDNPYFPNYLCGFNNLGGAGNKSCVDIFNPPYNGYNYDLTPGSSYGPATYAWRYTDSLATPNEGNSQQLPNGNTLVCITSGNRIREVNINGDTLWNFIPNGSVAMALRYSKCYIRGPSASAGASSTHITVGTPVTLNSTATSVTETNSIFTFSWSSVPANFTSSSQNPTFFPDSTATYIVTVTDTTVGCSDTASVTVVVDQSSEITIQEDQNEFIVYPNPTTGAVNISGNFINDPYYDVTVRNANGEIIINASNSPTLDFSGFAKGIYYISVKSGDSEISNYKIVY